jgi:predicted metal-dependent hydrolase
MAFLATQTAWIAAGLAALPPSIAFVDGAAIALAGRRLRIRRCVGSAPPRVVARELLVCADNAGLPGRVGAFLQSEAERRFAQLVTRKATQIGVRPRRVLLKDLRSRWGSCTAERTLTFSWRLVMAPPFVQDYVVAHEVAHLRHMNHGAQFQVLERELSRFVDPAKAWLRRYGAGLLRVG